MAANIWTVTRGQDGTTAAAGRGRGQGGDRPETDYRAAGRNGTGGRSAHHQLAAKQRWFRGPVGSPPSNHSLSATVRTPSSQSLVALYVGPKHYLLPDITTGWVEVDTANISGGFQKLINIDTTQVVTGGCPPLPAPSTAPCFNDLTNPGGAPAGSAVAGASQGAGTDLAIIFQATRVGVASVDYSNSLCKIHINNWVEVNNLWIQEFNGPATCCTPIDATLTVQFTVDHEEMDSGAWSLGITSCSGSAPGCISSVTSLAYAINAVKTSFEVAPGNLPSLPFNAPSPAPARP